MTVTKEKYVTIAYNFSTPEGYLLGTSDRQGPLTFCAGSGDIIPGLDNALAGAEEGQVLDFVIPAAEAYGERDETLVAKLAAAYRHEDAFRQETHLAVVLIPLALILPATGIGRALMIGSVLLVLIVELLNSAIEAAVDRISLDDHLLAKRAKDIGSAAVLISLFNVAVVWALVLLG